jgi:hypothetical protein
VFSRPTAQEKTVIASLTSAPTAADPPALVTPDADLTEVGPESIGPLPFLAVRLRVAS